MKHLMLFIWSVCHFIITYAQPVITYQNDYLSCNRITCLEQDAYGFIWIATEDGLNKFDGYKFTNFFHDEKDSTTIVCNYINSIYADSQKRLWVASNKGIQFYLPQENAFRTIKLPSNAHPNVTCITELHNGDIWFAASGAGIYSIKPGMNKADHLTWIGKLCDYSYVNCIYEDTRHNVWISYLGKLSCISPDMKQVTTYKLPQTSYPKVYGMKEDTLGNLYLITYDDILVKSPLKGNFTSVLTSDNFKVAARGITQTQDAKLLVNTVKNGLMSIDTEKKRVYPLNIAESTFNTSIYGEIVSYLEDNDGNKWLAYRQKGLVMIPNERKLFDPLKITIPSTQIFPTTIYQDHNNDLWIGSRDGSLLQLDKNKKPINLYTLPHHPLTIHERDGLLWVGSDGGGIYKIDLHTKKLHQTSLFANKTIKKIIEGNDNKLYLSCTGKGLGIYNPTNQESTLISYQTPMNNSITLGNDWINDLLCDKDGLIWIAHFTGIRCYDTSKNIFLDLPVNNEIKNQVCYELLEDDKERLWIGTNNGIYIYHKQEGTLQHIGKKEGLPSNVICGLEQDSKGNVWCSTYKGICSIEPENQKIVTYYSGNGLSDKEYNIGLSLLDNSGYIYFGGFNEITRFMPDSIEINKVLCTPVLTNLHIDNVLVNASQSASTENNPTDKYSVYTNNLCFGPESNTYAFEFSSFNYHNTKNTYFKYRLKELNYKWNHTLLGENRITYNYLPAGKYTLEVQAYENNISSPIRSIAIEILSPWYLTTRAVILYVIGFILLITGLIYLFIRHQNHKRKDEINEEKIRFFINIAHEIRSPLTLIINPLDDLLNKNAGSENFNMLKIIKLNTTRIMNLMNQLLDIRRIDQGQMKIKCKKVNIIDFIADIYEIFSYQATNRNITFTFTHTSKEVFAWIDVNNFDKIIINLLSNAFKYTPDGGEIEITVSTKENQNNNLSANAYVEICVQDTGKGLNEKDIEKIFERFYQTPSNRSLGFGIGLNLAKMLVELHHGTIHAKNRTDKQGSCFTIQIPLEDTLLSIEELEDAKTESLIINTVPMEGWMENTNNFPTAKNKKYRILFVDDDREMCEYIQNKLGCMYHVTIYHNGQDALQAVMDQSFDLVISDIVMPIMDGFELLHRIKITPQIGYLPVILLTSQTELDNRIKGYKERADAFLPKPFVMDELIALCSNLIENRILIRSKYGILEKNINSIEIKSNDELFLERLMKIITDNLADTDFTVENLAEKAGISRVQLHRKLKDLVGISTSEFVRNFRLKQAAELLKENKVNISQISYLVGYSNPTLFSSNFKKAYGCSPKEYREQHMKQNNM